jgi:O-antigen/teichoic acid export membrane protein
MKDSTLRELGIILLRPAAVGAALVGPLWFGESWMLALMGVANSREAIETFRALTWVQILVWPAAAAGCALTAKRLYRPQLFITALLTVVSAIGSASLVPAYGSVGAAAVLGLNATTMLALSYLVLWQASAGAALGSRQERAPA